MEKILYVGWLGFGNVGDELMWDVFREECRRRLPADEFEIVPSIPGIHPRQNEPYDWFVLGGGSLIMPRVYRDPARRPGSREKNHDLG